MPNLQVQVSRDAAGYINEHGGQLFIWVDDHGLLHWRLEPPTGANSWSRFGGQGITIYVDESALGVSYWRVVLDHLPWKRLHAYSDVNVGIRSLNLDERGVHLGDGPSPSGLLPLSAE
jgi:hypothetical protein